MQIALYIPKRSWLSALDFRVKIAFALAVLALDYLLIRSPAGAAFLFSLICALVISAGLGRDILQRFAKFFLAIMLVSVLIQGVFHGGPTVLVRFPDTTPLLAGMPILTFEGILFGIVIALKLLTIALAFLLMVISTPPSRIVQGLLKLGLPFKYATLVTMIFRFYPVMAGEFLEVQQAQASRGFEVEKGSLFRKFMNFLPLMIPALLSALRKSTVITIALEFRGYSLNTRRNFLHDPPLGKADAALFSLTVVLIVALVLLRLLGYGV